MYVVRHGRLRVYIDRDGIPEQRAYLRRGDFFEKRRQLMDAWAQFATPPIKATV